MPRYEFQCAECSNIFETRMSMSDYSSGSRPKCPACGAEEVVRCFSSIGIMIGSRGGVGSSSSGGGGCGHSGFT
jgi:putative FmdB family regulatory protein